MTSYNFVIEFMNLPSANSTYAVNSETGPLSVAKQFLMNGNCHCLSTCRLTPRSLQTKETYPDNVMLSKPCRDVCALSKTCFIKMHNFENELNQASSK